MTLFVTFQYIVQHFGIHLKIGSLLDEGVDIIKVKTTLYKFGADVCRSICKIESRVFMPSVSVKFELNCSLFGLIDFILSHRFNYEYVMRVFEYNRRVCTFGFQLRD